MIGSISASTHSVHARMNRPPADAPAAVATPAAPPPSSGSPDAQQPAAGVLRLLSEGHFKGVADVRLRINFAEELQAQQHAQQSDAVPQAVADLTARITDAFAPFVQDVAAQTTAGGEDAPPATLPDALAAFAAATAVATEAFADPRGSLDDLRISLQEAFAALVSAAQPFVAAALTPPEPPPTGTEGEVAPEPPLPQTPAPTEQLVDEEVSAAVEPQVADPAPTDAILQVELPQQPPVEPADIEDPTPDPTAQFFADLQQTFDAALAQVMESLGSMGQLPPLSAPSGNGGAYAKFLAMYQALQSAPAAETVLAVEA